jgi:hypothetical protein
LSPLPLRQPLGSMRSVAAEKNGTEDARFSSNTSLIARKPAPAKAFVSRDFSRRNDAGNGE